jgi:hypothetical protein
MDAIRGSRSSSVFLRSIGKLVLAPANGWSCRKSIGSGHDCFQMTNTSNARILIALMSTAMALQSCVRVPCQQAL